MILTFKTTEGTISMCGKTGSQYALKSVTGLGLPEKNYEYISYYGSDGKTTLNSYLSSRVITISGDIYNCNKQIMRKTMKILYSEGTLTVHDETFIKEINYKPLSFEFTERHGSIQSFAFQIECDYPYFQDVRFTQKDIYTKTNNISSPFTLPAVFSNRTSTATVVNSGDVKVYPVFVISSSSNESATGNYTLNNLSTNASLTMYFTCDKGEEITIDTSKRTIISNRKGNIVHSLKNGAMSDFYLQKGENIIECLCDNITASPYGAVLFKNCYMEAL